MIPSIDPLPDYHLLPWWRRGAIAWNRFWFTPRDPTLLGFMRITCGAITLYTMLAYSLTLQDFMGENAWYSLDLRLNTLVRERPTDMTPLSGRESLIAPAPVNEFQAKYFDSYRNRYGEAPPPPYPSNQKEIEMADKFRQTYNRDLRTFGLPFPQTDKEYQYLDRYAQKYRMPPPAYPKTDEEEAEIDAFIQRQNIDPRRLYAKGIPIWSLWFHITDPTTMAWIHAGVCLVVFFFMIGLATRVTSVLTWMTCLWYIHRNTICLFGFDTMMTILLLYLMIGPSGAALSVDRWLARWWSKSKGNVINRWRGLFGKPPLSKDQLWPSEYQPTPAPQVSANVAIRLLQIHLCIIYCIAGLSKLIGPAWWNGYAVWSTLANFEFAPMQFEGYNWFLKTISKNQLVFELFMTSAGHFTLAFEISYPFLIWNSRTRWWSLSGAIILHGFIGLFMGLKTFSMMMLVMNAAFLTHGEVVWILTCFGYKKPSAPTISPAAEPRALPTRPPLDAIRSAVSSLGSKK